MQIFDVNSSPQLKSTLRAESRSINVPDISLPVSRGPKIVRAIYRGVLSMLLRFFLIVLMFFLAFVMANLMTLINGGR